jgi:predicted RNA polymerase sigma factor
MLRVALSKIAPIYREAFLLREFEGYDYGEIARITNATEMNVKVRITRAKKQLRILLAPVYKYEASRADRKSHSTGSAEASEIMEVEEEEVSV